MKYEEKDIVFALIVKMRFFAKRSFFLKNQVVLIA